MKLSVKGLALSTAILWGVGFFLLELVNLSAPSYGSGFLQVFASVYPGFHFSRSFGDAVIGGIDAILDGALAGFLFGVFYNAFARASGA